MKEQKFSQLFFEKKMSYIYSSLCNRKLAVCYILLTVKWKSINFLDGFGFFDLHVNESKYY